LRGAPAIAATLLAASALSCARPTPPRVPEGEDYVFPGARPGELRPEESRRIERAWRSLTAGDVAAATESFRRLLAQRPGLVPAETGLGYARLRAGRFAEAGTLFDSVLARAPEYLPALLGAGSAASRRGEAVAALGFYRRAQAAAPQDPVARRRLAEVKLQVTERRVAEAHAALQAGDSDRATEMYRLALEAAPEVAGLRLELANLLVSRGEAAAAAAVLEADPEADRQVLIRLGEVLIGLGEYPRALEAYRRLLARDPRDPEALRRSREAREALELLQMPEEYRLIAAAPRITRADLAALVSVKVTALARITSREPKVAVDISGSWAREHIVTVLALDIMDVYPNHTFQPGAIVRRGDLARALGRTLDLLRYPRSPSPALTDMPPSNLFYDDAVRAVGAGLLELSPTGAFEPWRPVSGREALDVLEALVRLVGP
jgi:tetratricopeptide (TPR) repeat protein